MQPNPAGRQRASCRSFLRETAKTTLDLAVTLLAGALFAGRVCAAADQTPLAAHRLIPYPQKVTGVAGSLRISSQPNVEVELGAEPAVRIGQQQLEAFFARISFSRKPAPRAVRIRIGTVGDSTRRPPWLTAQELDAARGLHVQGYLLRIGQSEIRVVGRTGLGALYGVQTLLQLLSQARPTLVLPRLEIEDYPEVPERFLAIQLAWYASAPGQQTFGFGSQLWTAGQWKWFLDWCLRHKINGIDLCMYGYWPFPFPEYPESVLADRPVKTWDEQTGKIVTRRMTHPNVEREFLPEVIRYAQARGIRVNAYIGLNSYNGGYLYHHPETHPFLPDQAASAGRQPGQTYHYDEMDLSHAAVRKYLRDSVQRMMRMGFDGVTFEMNEGVTTVCTKPACIPLFWGGYEHLVTPVSMPKQTPLQVRVRSDAALLNDLYRAIAAVRPAAEVGLIYHMLTYRYGWKEETLAAVRRLRALLPDAVYFTQGPRAPLAGELAGSQFERWLEIVDRKTYRHGSNLGGAPTIFFNNDPETRGDGGENDYWLWPLQLSIAQDRAAAKLRLRGSTAYAFSWYGQEILPLITAQYSWRSAGPPGVADRDYLRYASQSMYGENVGRLAARAFALPPPGDPHYQPPASGTLAEGEAILLARQALREYRGEEPEYRRSLEHLHTANAIRAANFELQQLLQKAKSTVRPEERRASLQRALAQAERVRALVLRGTPRILYLDAERSLLINYTRVLPEYYGKSVIDFPPIEEIRKELQSLERNGTR